MYEYAYAIWALIALLVWCSMYVALPAARRQMLILSCIFAPIGIVGGYLNSLDYFMPPRLFGTLWSIEDIVIGFTYGGIAAGLYSLIKNETELKAEKPVYWVYGLLVLFLAALWMWGLQVFGVHSFYSFAVFALGAGFVICVLRPRLWRSALFTGSALCVGHTVFYVLFFALFPNALTWWHLNDVSGILLWRIPIEEFVWVFAFGFVLGPTAELAVRLPLPHWFRSKSWS